MMLSKVEHMWAMHFFLVPLIVFNLEKHANQGRAYVGYAFPFSAPYCLQLGNTCKMNG
jgi:hypothetical protein